MLLDPAGRDPLHDPAEPARPTGAFQKPLDHVVQGGHLPHHTVDFDAGFKDADIIYAKSWGCWMATEDKAESAVIGKKYTNWITGQSTQDTVNKVEAAWPK